MSSVKNIAGCIAGESLDGKTLLALKIATVFNKLNEVFNLPAIKVGVVNTCGDTNYSAYSDTYNFNLINVPYEEHDLKVLYKSIQQLKNNGCNFFIVDNLSNPWLRASDKGVVKSPLE